MFNGQEKKLDRVRFFFIVSKNRGECTSTEDRPYIRCHWAHNKHSHLRLLVLLEQFRIRREDPHAVTCKN
jgi:hypothetical protein